MVQDLDGSTRDDDDDDDDRQSARNSDDFPTPESPTTKIRTLGISIV